MATAYHDSITMRHPDDESPTTFGIRIETNGHRLDVFFRPQDVKDVFINGLQEIIPSDFRVLDGQFPKRTLSDPIRRANGIYSAKVRWFDYGPNDDSWEPSENLPRNQV